MVRVAAGRVDVQAEPSRLGQAAEHVVGQARVSLQPHLGDRPPAEVDGRSCERVVHREDGIAEAGNSTPVSEGLVEGLAESDGGVLDGVVLAGLQVAGRLEARSKPAWKASCSRRWS